MCSLWIGREEYLLGHQRNRRLLPLAHCPRIETWVKLWKEKSLFLFFLFLSLIIAREWNDALYEALFSRYKMMQRCKYLAAMWRRKRKDEEKGKDSGFYIGQEGHVQRKKSLGYNSEER